jgi:hypothetical protein
MQSPPESLLNGVHILHDCEWLSNTEWAVISSGLLHMKPS